MVPPPNSAVFELALWTAAGATDILDKEPFSRRGGIQKERVIVPWAGRRRLGDRVSGFDAPALDGLASLIFFPPIHRRAQSGLQLGLVHRFWTIVGGIIAGFVLEHLFQSFHLGHPV